MLSPPSQGGDKQHVSSMLIKNEIDSYEVQMIKTVAYNYSLSFS